MDRLARLLVGDEVAGAACLVGNKIYVATNEEIHSSISYSFVRRTRYAHDVSAASHAITLKMTVIVTITDGAEKHVNVPFERHMTFWCVGKVDVQAGSILALLLPYPIQGDLNFVVTP